jgi:hypothetical protein
MYKKVFYISSHRTEVADVILTEYDEQKYRAMEKKEWLAEGEKLGEARGEMRGEMHAKKESIMKFTAIQKQV